MGVGKTQRENKGEEGNSACVLHKINVKQEKKVGGIGMPDFFVSKGGTRTKGQDNVKFNLCTCMRESVCV